MSPEEAYFAGQAFASEWPDIHGATGPAESIEQFIQGIVDYLRSNTLKKSVVVERDHSMGLFKLVAVNPLLPEVAGHARIARMRDACSSFANLAS